MDMHAGRTGEWCRQIIKRLPEALTALVCGCVLVAIGSASHDGALITNDLAEDLGQLSWTQPAGRYFLRDCRCELVAYVAPSQSLGYRLPPSDATTATSVLYPDRFSVWAVRDAAERKVSQPSRESLLAGSTSPECPIAPKKPGSAA